MQNKKIHILIIGIRRISASIFSSQKGSCRARVGHDEQKCPLASLCGAVGVHADTHGVVEVLEGMGLVGHMMGMQMWTLYGPLWDFGAR